MYRIRIRISGLKKLLSFIKQSLYNHIITMQLIGGEKLSQCDC